MTRKIYLASSWRNICQADYVKYLRDRGHLVYDFQNPASEPSIADRMPTAGFAWAQIDAGWREWTPDELASALLHPIATEGYRADYVALEWADTCVLLLPSGRSAHLECGFMVGRGKPTAICLDDQIAEPELMYRLADTVVPGMLGLIRWLDELPDRIS